MLSSETMNRLSIEVHYKKTALVLLFFLFAGTSLFAADWRLTVGVSKVLDLRIGTEVDFVGAAGDTGPWGMKADIGYSLISTPPNEMYLSWDLLGTYRFTDPQRRIVVKGLFGLIDAAVITTEPPVFAFSPGLSVFTGVRLGKRFDIGLRGGIGTLLQIEDWELNNDFPWFDIALEAHFHFSPWTGWKPRYRSD